MPVPTGPQWWIVVPIAWSIGRTRRKSSSDAPTMKSDSPRSACAASRPTGASTTVRPRSAAALAIRSVVFGSTVLISTTTCAGRARHAATHAAEPDETDLVHWFYLRVVPYALRPLTEHL